MSTLVKKILPEQINAIVDKMGTKIVAVTPADTEEPAKDVFVDGLRNIIASVDESNGKLFATKLLETMLKGLKSKQPDEVLVKLMCLDVVRDLVQVNSSMPSFFFSLYVFNIVRQLQLFDLLAAFRYGRDGKAHGASGRVFLSTSHHILSRARHYL